MTVERNVEIQTLQSRFAEMSESDFTHQVVMPLLKALGYTADHYGGAYEDGKDIVIWKVDEFDEVCGGVVQVKTTKIGVSTRKVDSFSDLINQLQQAKEKAISNSNGKTYIPSIVLFITSQIVKTRALQSRFEQYSTLSTKGIKILDGAKIAALILDKCPGLVSQLLGHGTSIMAETLSQLTNDVLMAALRTSTKKSLHGFYCDLSFSMGKRSDSFLRFGVSVPHSNEMVVLSSDVVTLKALNDRIVSQAGIPLCKENFVLIEKRLHDRVSELRETLRREVVFIKDELWAGGSESRMGRALSWDKAMERLFLWFEEFKDGLPDRLVSQKKPKRYWLRKLFAFVEHLRREELYPRIDKMQSCLRRICKNIGKERLLKDISFTELNSRVTEIVSLIEDYNKKFNDGQKSVCVSINWIELAGWLNDKRKRVYNTILEINQRKVTGAHLAQFLRDLEKILQLVDDLGEVFSDVKFKGGKSALGAEIAYSGVLERLVVKVPIGELFSTGLNFSICGGAGAGKTTTLQMYALQSIERHDGTLVLFVPLVAATARLKKRSRDGRVRDPVDELLTGVWAMHSAKCVFSKEELRCMLANQKSLILLDGIDEVIKDFAWILNAIADLSRAFPKAQILSSSRDNEAYAEKIPFIGLTMLEFNDGQRTQFITEWFRCESGTVRGEAASVLAHIEQNKHIGDVIRNPLNATIMCVLAENGLDLPERELQLYRDRMRLLLGEFDVYKNVKRLASHPDTLIKISVKIAYFLHSNSRRWESLENLRAVVLDLFKSKLPEKTVGIAFDELVAPAGMLVPMTASGEFGFGHLKFQEYLVALELQSNRNINLFPLVYEEWWRGPLVLLAQMSDDLEFLFRGALERGKVGEALPTLNAMLKDKSQEWVERMDEWIERQRLLDGYADD